MLNAFTKHVSVMLCDLRISNHFSFIYDMIKTKYLWKDLGTRSYSEFIQKNLSTNIMTQYLN